MTQTEAAGNAVTADGNQIDLLELQARVAQLESEHAALAAENKSLRFLLERAVEHRQKSHGELVLLLSGLVSKLPINDVGIIVSKLVEHNKQVGAICSALVKGTIQDLPQPDVLRNIDHAKRDLAGALKTAVEELIKLDTPLDAEMLRSLVTQPKLFFSPAVVRTTRAFVKGHVLKERVVREFGDGVLIFFNDMTTDPRRNPTPKPDEIVLGFKGDFEALFKANPDAASTKRAELLALYEKIQRGKGEQGRAQKNAFLRMSFLLELLHYYENQSTEAPDVLFAQKLPALIEPLVITNPQEPLDARLIAQAEQLLTLIISPDHRLMVINNIGKSGGAGRTLRYVLRLRAEKSPEQNPLVQLETIPDFVRHLIPPPPETAPQAQAIVPILKLVSPEFQRRVLRAILHSDRLRRGDAEVLGRLIVKDLNLEGFELEQPAHAPALIAATEQNWDKIKELIASHADASMVAAAFRDRLHAKFDADELKASWVTLTEAEPILFIRTFSQLPYLADGTTDPIARPVLESYVTRLMHEKYAATHTKVVNSLKNMFKANANAPALVNFIALVKWVDAEAAAKLSAQIGMAT